MKSIPKTAIIIPNLNGMDSLAACLESLGTQTATSEIIIVENASIDGSLDWLTKHYPDITVLPQAKNLGFAGGVNVGIRYALDHDCVYVALFNNDAVATPDWLERLVTAAEQHPESGIFTGTFTSIDKRHIDSTGDIYTNWGLSYPRGRGLPATQTYPSGLVFGASGGASLYRATMLRDIGLFDEDFFAYYEDVDISFRAQLAGWTVWYQADAIAYHQIGATSGKLKGFTTYQTMKNLPLLAIKNVPGPYLNSVIWRLTIARSLFMLRAISRRQGWAAIRGDAKATSLIFKKMRERRRIQTGKRVSNEYIWSIMTHDLPPNAMALRNLRSKYWKLNRKRT